MYTHIHIKEKILGVLSIDFINLGEPDSRTHTHPYKASDVPHSCLSIKYTMPSRSAAALEVSTHTTVGIEGQG